MASMFWKYFQENMNEIGLDVPEHYYTQFTTAMGLYGGITGVIWQVGGGASVRLIFSRAALQGETSAVVGAMGLCYYSGAIVGSLAVASGRTLSGGHTIAEGIDAIKWMAGLDPDVKTVLRTHPEIMNRNHPGRKTFAKRTGLAK